MSKSLGTAVDPLEAAERLGRDPLRLYLVKEVPYGSDGDFSWERFEERYNADLANNLGNLVSRIASMAERYVGGRVAPAGEPGPLAAAAAETLAAYRAAMDAFALHDARQRDLPAARRRQRVHRSRPRRGSWPRIRRSAARLGQVLFDVAEAVRVAGGAAAADHARVGCVKYCAGSARPPTRRRCVSIGTRRGARPASGRW